MQRTDEKKGSILIEPTVSFRCLIDQLPSLSGEKQRQIYEITKSHLLECYLQAVEEVKRGENLPTDEKLKKLLVPLICYNQLDPFGNPIPFVEESVDIERDLDIENLRYDEERYQIYDVKGDQIDASRVHGLVTSSSYIFVGENSDSDLQNSRGGEVVGSDPIFHLGKISLRDLHKEWLPLLNQEKITSRDLLDQVLVAYTIKQALNGNENAIQKLCDLYKDAAEALAVKFANRFGLRQEIKDLKTDVQLLLRFVVSGFRPEDIISQLLGDNSEKVIKVIPPWVKHFLIYYFSEYIPRRMERNIRETQTNQDLISDLAKIPSDHRKNEVEQEIALMKVRNARLHFEWIGIFSPYAPLQADTLWKGTPKRINRFNSYSFRPGLKEMGPRWNLTTWLFGRKGEIDTLAKSQREDGTRGKAWQPYGKLYQLLRDKYIPLIKKKSKTESLDHNDDFHEQVGNKGKRSKIHSLRAKEGSLEKSPEQIVDQLVKHGATPRDAEIFTKWKFLKSHTQKELEKEYALSERWIRNICRRVEARINSR